MAKLITTNLRFPQGTYRELRYQATRRGVPVAMLVREAVDRYPAWNDETDAIPFGSDPADEGVGTIHSPNDDESVNHDHYLYGWPKEEDGQAPGRQQRTRRARPARGSEPR